MSEFPRPNSSKTTNLFVKFKYDGHFSVSNVEVASIQRIHLCSKYVPSVGPPLVPLILMKSAGNAKYILLTFVLHKCM